MSSSCRVRPRKSAGRNTNNVRRVCVVLETFRVFIPSTGTALFFSLYNVRPALLTSLRRDIRPDL